MEKLMDEILNQSAPAIAKGSTATPAPAKLRRPLRRHLGEKVIEAGLFLAAFSAVAVTLAIIVILVRESVPFFRHVPLSDFLTDTQWTPLFDDAHFGILPLLAGTLTTTAV